VTLNRKAMTVEPFFPPKERQPLNQVAAFPTALPVRGCRPSGPGAGPVSAKPVNPTGPRNLGVAHATRRAAGQRAPSAKGEAPGKKGEAHRENLAGRPNLIRGGTV